MFTIAFLGMFAVVVIFGLIPLKTAAEYRFRSKFSLTAEGIAFLVCAVFGLLNFATLTGFFILSAGIVAGATIRSSKGYNDRYLDEGW
jgi:hypothetical protein